MSLKNAEPIPTREDVLAYLSRTPRSHQTRSRAPLRHQGRRQDRPQAHVARSRRTRATSNAAAAARLTRTGDLPEVTVVEVVERDTDGELICRPAQWDSDAKPPRSCWRPVRTEPSNGRALGIGERFLARLKRDGRRLRSARHQAPRHPARTRRSASSASSAVSGRVEPVDRKARNDFIDRRRRHRRRRRRRTRRRRTAGRPRHGPTARAHRRTLGPHARTQGDQPDRRPRARHPRPISPPPSSTRPNARSRQRLRAARGSAQNPARHHRPARRARPRRRGVGTARRRSRQQRRLQSDRRHRRRRPTTCGRTRRSTAKRSARQLGLFPRPRRADAAGTTVGRSLLAEGKGRSRHPRLPSDIRRATAN